ncbi:MAG: PhzF family phenazine biosynthesis protein [Actinomycetota bacterium]
MTVRLLQIDAFTDSPFAGNPAAVALVDGGSTPVGDDAHLQAIALEMNLSETAFPVRRDDGDWDLRWFTPAAEVDLCGHATLATAHALLTEGLVDDEEITFHTRSGPLVCRRSDDGIIMDFPASPAEPAGPVPGLEEALGVATTAVGRSFDLVAEVATPETVASVTPDLGALARIETRAVIVTAAGDVDGGDAHFVSRVFGPRVGVPEDPVTGSAHCILAPWWSERLDRTEFRAHQASPRGGRLGVRLIGDRVELEGNAVTVLDGTLAV